MLLEVVVVSMDGLLDAHEVSVRARVEALREQAARVAAELGGAELALEHVAITRATLALVAAGAPARGQGVQGADAAGPGAPTPSLVPVWREGLAEAHLPAGYRQLWRALAEAPAPVRAQQLAAALGLESTAAKVEGVRAKLKRLVARGWITEPAPGAFACAPTGPACPAGGS